MDTFSVDDDQLKVTGLDGFLTVKNSKGQTVVIQERPMLEFEEFYKKWTLAMKVGGKDDFLNAWVYNDSFRMLTQQALEIMGITEVGLYTLSQLEALLIGYKGGPGLLFQLHNSFPKLLTQAPETRTWRISFKTAQILTISIWQEYTHTQSWMGKLLSKVGLCLVSCGFWLSSRLPKLPATQKRLKVCAKPDGQPTLEILR
jgi:hypothetical protein